MFEIAAFYLFAGLADPGLLRGRLVALGTERNVKGTVVLASEGVNGTIAGARQDVDAFLELLRERPALTSLEVKRARADRDPFVRLKVRVKGEIVTLGVGDVDSVNNTATHLSATEWNELISDSDTIVIDTRNSYEHAIGTFANAVNPDTRRFGDFPAWIENQPDIKHKKLAMFCTGGVRCEKGTAYLREQGFTDVYQLDGGVLKYLEVVDPEESLWDGECYVFDRRVSVGHGLVVGNREICPNCNAAIGDEIRSRTGYRRGVHCGDCVTDITEDRMARFAERQYQIDLAAARSEHHLSPTV